MNWDIDSFIFSNPGGREYNEDAAAGWADGDAGLFALADGLGGHLHGEMASQLAVDSIFDDPQPQGQLNAWLAERMELAHQQILALQQENGGMRSTAVALAIRGKEACWAHIGDSRLYYLHNRRLAMVTEDHSVAYAKFRSGEISRMDIARDSDQSLLLRALGNPRRYQPEVPQAPIRPEAGDGFLLCSDGLWTCLRDTEVLADFLKARSAQEWGRLLLLRCLERMEPPSDNVSLITVVLQEQ